MSSIGPADVSLSSPSASKTKKHKKKKPGGKLKVNGVTEKLNGDKNAEGGPDEEDPDEPDTPAGNTPQHIQSEETAQNGTRSPAANGIYHEPIVPRTDNPVAEEPVTSPRSPTYSRSRKATILTEPQREAAAQIDDSRDTGARLDALVKERETLRDEVAELRKSLEEIQVKHIAELGGVRKELENTEGERDHAETKYRDLLGRVNIIKSQLGERLKAGAEDLSQARSQIEDLEEQNTQLQDQNSTREAELAKLAEESEQRSKELSSLRNRLNLSQQNWTKEREDLLKREQYAKEEFESARQAMQDWEILAMEERSIRENLAERVADLEEQVSSHREAYEKAAADRDSQSLTVDGLHRALQELQEARKSELREIVENSQAQVEELRKQLQKVQSKSAESTAALELAQKELEKALPFEKEVKEKNLLIGKLRHEAVILNDHLTKALRHLKKGKPDDNIDKQLITNHFLHFLGLERSDPKKFQILQIMAALLSWTDEQREQAGLARPGASNPSLRTPISPWHRTPSTPSLSVDTFQESRGRNESLAGLWSDFLEQEASEGAKSSRSTSISSAVKPP